MEKRLALAVALCVGFLILWSYLFPTTPPRAPRAGAPAATTEGTTSSPSEAGGRTGAAAGGAAAPAGATATGLQAAPSPGATAIAAAAEEEITLDLPQATVHLTNRGARIRSFILKGYRDHRGQPLDLVSPAATKLDRLPLDLLTDDAALDERLKTGLYRVERQETGAGADAASVLTLRWSDGNGTGATKTLRAGGAAGLVEITVTASAPGRAVDPAIAWGAGFEEEIAEASERTGVGVRGLRSVGGKIERRYQSKIPPGEPWTDEGSTEFAGIESKYFAAVLVPPAGTVARLKVETLRLVEDGREHLHLTFSLRPPAGVAVRLYAGPKSYEVLRAAGLGLDRLLDFGFFGFIAHPLFEALKFLHRYTGNYGWAIVILTVLIRALFFPFLHRSQLKMRQMQEKMKRIQPKLKSLKERYHRLEQKAAEKGSAG